MRSLPNVSFGGHHWCVTRERGGPLNVELGPLTFELYTEKVSPYSLE